MEDETLMTLIGGKVRLIENCIRDRESSVAISGGVVFVRFRKEVIGQPDESLRGNGSGRAVDWLRGIEWIRMLIKAVAKEVQLWSTGIPHWNAVGAGIGEVKIGGRERGSEENLLSLSHAASFEFQGAQKFQLLGKT